jgi:tRNA(fMet)-specific endonuclease VapC
LDILYLLDTNILVHIIRNDPLGQYIKAIYGLFMAEPRPIICTVSEGELRSLAYQWKWGVRRNEQIRFLLDYFDDASIERSAVQLAYAMIDSYSLSFGHAMGKNDIWIAAACYVTGARLLTTDTDFDHLHPHLIYREYISPETNVPDQSG